MPKREWEEKTDEERVSDEEGEDKWRLEEDEEEEVDEADLAQLPGVNKALAERLKEEGYNSLWDISMADIDDLVESVGITMELATKIIAETDELLGIRR